MLGLSLKDSVVYPPSTSHMVILISNMMIDHWNLRYHMFRQIHAKQTTKLSMSAASSLVGGAAILIHYVDRLIFWMLVHQHGPPRLLLSFFCLCQISFLRPIGDFQSEFKFKLWGLGLMQQVFEICIGAVKALAASHLSDFPSAPLPWAPATRRASRI